MILFLSYLVVFVGFALQVLIPFHVIDLREYVFIGISGDMAGFFGGTILIVVGTFMVYFFHYRNYTNNMDKTELHKD